MDVEKSFKKEILRSIKKHLEWETIGVKKGEEIKPEQILKVLNNISKMWDGHSSHESSGLNKPVVNCWAFYCLE